MPRPFRRPGYLYDTDITNWAGVEDNRKKTRFYVHLIYKHSQTLQKRAELIGYASKDDCKQGDKHHSNHPDTVFFKIHTTDMNLVLKKYENTKWDLHSIETDCKELPCSGCFKTIRMKLKDIVGDDIPVRCFQHEGSKAYYVFQTGQNDSEAKEYSYSWHW